MQILKTFMGLFHVYLECEYKNKCPTYWFATKKMYLYTWDSDMSEKIRTYISIGYVHNQTKG